MRTELQKKAVIYINSDTNGRGFLFVGGSHSLQQFIDQVGQSVTDPETGVSVLARLRARAAMGGFSKAASVEQQAFAKKVAASKEFPIEALGSGSDYSSFLQHIGIATLNLGYGGEDDGGAYHSLYDSYDHYRRFGDPGFVYGVTLSQTSGHAVLRFADADILPYSYTDFADTVDGYVKQLQKLTDSMRTAAVEQNQLIAQHVFNLAADPTQPYFPPAEQSAVPYLDFAPLNNALVKLNTSAAGYDAARSAQITAGIKLDTSQVAKLNTLLQGMEQDLLYAPGLPGRPWYKHMIYAPGLYTGYGVKTLPGVREAIEQKQWDVATKYIPIIANTLDNYGARLDEATAMLKQ